MPILLNRARGYQRSSNIVIIDRSGPWGNPYIIGVDGDRDEVCDKHIVWLNEWINNKKEICIKVGIRVFSNKWVIEHLSLLRGKDVVCWCSPSRCHGDLLILLANKDVR